LTGERDTRGGSVAAATDRRRLERRTGGVQSFRRKDDVTFAGILDPDLVISFDSFVGGRPYLSSLLLGYYDKSSAGRDAEGAHSPRSALLLSPSGDPPCAQLSIKLKRVRMARQRPLPVWAETARRQREKSEPGPSARSADRTRPVSRSRVTGTPKAHCKT